MSKYATGKWAYGISDRSGFRYRLRDMRKEWNGLLVGKDEWERKQPQLEPLRVRPDPQALRDPRPETNLTEERSIQYGFNPVGYRGDALGFTENNLKAKGQVGEITIIIGPTQGSVANASGVYGTGGLGSVTVSAISAPRFDSTSVTLDSTTDTFDEG